MRNSRWELIKRYSVKNKRSFVHSQIRADVYSVNRSSNMYLDKYFNTIQNIYNTDIFLRYIFFMCLICLLLVRLCLLISLNIYVWRSVSVSAGSSSRAYIRNLEVMTNRQTNRFSTCRLDPHRRKGSSENVHWVSYWFTLASGDTSGNCYKNQNWSKKFSQAVSTME